MIEIINRAEYEVLLRRDFGTFAARCFGDLNPQAELATNWHLEVIAAKLTAVREGRIRRLIINIPYLFDFTLDNFPPNGLRTANRRLRPATGWKEPNDRAWRAAWGLTPVPVRER